MKLSKRNKNNSRKILKKTRRIYKEGANSDYDSDYESNKCNSSKQIKNRKIFISGFDVNYNVRIYETEQCKHIYTMNMYNTKRWNSY